LTKPRRLSHTIQKKMSNNHATEAATAATTATATGPTSSPPERDVKVRHRQEQPHHSSTPPPLQPRPQPNQLKNTAVGGAPKPGNISAGADAAAAMLATHIPDDDSSVMHISCTVASDEADNVQHRHSRSRGTLVCVECGMRFSNIKALQNHIQNKTVWTNRSLLGCRVSVMWAHNQWYEGTVTQYDVVHGRHCVVYDDGEQKWYHMANKTFYVVNLTDDGASSNDDQDGSSGGSGGGGGGNRFNHKTLAQQDLESKFYEEEPLNKDYLMAQSVVHACFGNATQQVGYRTDGHLCVTEQDRIVAHDTGSSLLYGEVLPRVSVDKWVWWVWWVVVCAAAAAAGLTFGARILGVWFSRLTPHFFLFFPFTLPPSSGLQ
jgi:hypothetical protein